MTNICSVPLYLVITSILTMFFVDIITIANYIPVHIALLYFYLELSSCIPGIQFAGLLILIKYLFASLNTTLKNYLGSSFSTSNRITYQNKTNTIINYASLLKKLLQTYNGLCDVTESINFSYSIVVLFSIARLSVSTVHSICYLLTTILFENAICDSASISSYVMWLFHQMGMMFGLVYISNSTVIEVRNIIY